MNRLSTFAALAVTLLWSLTSARAADDHFPTLELGASAPDFALPGVDDKTHKLADFASAKLLLVLFTVNHCPTAQYYEERLKKIVTDYQPKGLAVVAISPNDPTSVRLDELGYTDLSDSFEEMKIRATDRGYNFPYLYDGDTETVSKAYGPLATPHAFLFDAARKLRYVGRIDDSERPDYVTTHDLTDAIDQLLAGKEVTNPKTKVVGCSVKWGGKSSAVKTYMDKLATLPVTLEQVDAEGLKALRKNDSGKVRLVNFWSTFCGPCVTEFSEIVDLHRRFGHRNFEIVTVSANYPDEDKEVLAFLKKRQAATKNLIFASNNKPKLMEAFDPTWDDGLPYTLLISPKGEILWKTDRAIDPIEARRAIVKALKEDRFKN